MANVPGGLHHPTSVYAKQVTQGRLNELCCPAEIAACRRHLDDLARQGTPEFPFVFDTTRADRILRWFGLCIQVRGVYAGQPIALQPWQVFDLGCEYGWVEMETGYRRFRRALSKRGRGEAKSTENACKGLYHMCADCYYPPYRPDERVYEASPEVECAAVDRPQAMRVLGDAKAIALASPKIAAVLLVPRANPIVHRQRGGFMRALSKDTKNKDSGAPTYYCVDEYESHTTSKIYDIGLNSFGKRPQSFLDAIMTAGDNSENTPAKREEDYARKVLTGEIRDDRYFVMLRELPPEEDPHDRKKWAWANPMLRYPDEYGRILLSQIEDEYNAAYNSGDAEKIRAFLSRRLCQWQTTSRDSYLSEQQKELARAAQLPAAEFSQLVRGGTAWAGFDLGKRIDLSGAAFVIALPDGRYAIKMHGFLPQDALARHEHTDRVPYREWAAAGCCTLTPGAVTDNSYVYDWIKRTETALELDLREVDYDGHSATDLAIAINNDRGSDDFCVEIRQSCAGQTLAVKSFRELLLEGRIVLEQSELALWCLANAVVFQNWYGDLRLTKLNKDDSQRIDPVAATMNALGRALLKNDKPSLARAIDRGGYEM